MEFSVEYEAIYRCRRCRRRAARRPQHRDQKGPMMTLRRHRMAGPIPKGHHWDGHPHCEDLQGVQEGQRDISSEFWRSIGP